MRTLIIHNPKSGFGSDAIFEFERALLHPGDSCTFLMTDEDFSASELVANARDYDLVVISGGDGTVTSLLYALRGTEIPICIFPSGTANLFFSNLGDAPEPAALARACRSGETASVDLGEISWLDEHGEHLKRGLALMAGTGFDAQIMAAATPNKMVMGEAAYFAAAIANPRPDVIRFVIDVDGERYERDGITCLVADNAMETVGCGDVDGIDLIRRGEHSEIVEEESRTVPRPKVARRLLVTGVGADVLHVVGLRKCLEKALGDAAPADGRKPDTVHSSPISTPHGCHSPLARSPHAASPVYGDYGACRSMRRASPPTNRQSVTTGWDEMGLTCSLHVGIVLFGACEPRCW